MYLRKRKALKRLIEAMNPIDYDYDPEGVLWTVEKRGEETWILCKYLRWLNKYKKWAIEGDIAEFEGPAALTCPLRFFDLAPKEEFPEWREEVRNYHKGGPSVQKGQIALDLIEALKAR